MFKFLKIFLIFLAFYAILPCGKAYAVDIGDLRILGYIDMTYIKANKDEGNKNGSFAGEHFNLLFDFPVTDKLIVKSQLEFENGLNSELNYGEVELEYAFFEYTFWDELKLRGGKIMTPFGYYNELRDVTPFYLSVDVPGSIYYASMQGGIDFFPIFNTGGSVLGGHTFFEYSDYPLEIDYYFYVGNGESRIFTNPGQFDDNANKAVGGRININFADLVNFGASVYSGDKAITNNLDAVHNAYSAYLQIDTGFFNVTAEGAYSKLKKKGQGATSIQASFLLFDKISPFYRFEYLDPDLFAPDDGWTTHIYGLNFSPIPGVAFKAELNFHRRGRNNSTITFGHKSYHELKTGIAIAF